MAKPALKDIIETLYPPRNDQQINQTPERLFCCEPKCVHYSRKKNKIQSTILIIKSFPMPHFKKTATGGKSIDNTIKTILFI